MKRTITPVVAASSLLLGVACAGGFVPTKGLETTPTGDLPQAIITYGFLSWNYGDFDRLFGSRPTSGLVRSMNALRSALDSLNCDVTVRMGFPHRAFIVPSSPGGQWIGFVRTAETPPDQATLFVTEPLGGKSERVLVVLSSVAPERTTVFWIQGSTSDFASGLVYDSFKKGLISNAPHTVMGAVTTASVGGSDEVLLREWAELGSRPRTMGSVGRVFAVNLVREEVTIKSSGVSPQH